MTHQNRARQPFPWHGCVLLGEPRLLKPLHLAAAGEGTLGQHGSSRGVYEKAGYVERGTTTRAISEVQDTEPYSLYFKSGVFCKVGNTFLEHSGLVSKSPCFLNSHLALHSPPPDPHHICLRGSGGPWFSPCPPVSPCSNTACTLLIY